MRVTMFPKVQVIVGERSWVVGPVVVRIGHDRRRWEVQISDKHFHLTWFSDGPYLSRRRAVRLAKQCVGQRVRVVHVGTGRVAYERVRSSPVELVAYPAWFRGGQTLGSKQRVTYR